MIKKIKCLPENTDAICDEQLSLGATLIAIRPAAYRRDDLRAKLITCSFYDWAQTKAEEISFFIKGEGVSEEDRDAESAAEKIGQESARLERAILSCAEQYLECLKTENGITWLERLRYGHLAERTRASSCYYSEAVELCRKLPEHPIARVIRLKETMLGISHRASNP